MSFFNKRISSILNKGKDSVKGLYKRVSGHVNDFSKKVKMWLIVTFVVILVFVSFGSSGSSIFTIFSSSSDANVIGTVGDKDITVREFNDIYARKVESISRMLGSKLSEDKIKSIGIAKMAINEIINVKLIDNVVDELGLDIGPESVADFIKSRGFFKNEKGEFDKLMFSDHLKRNHITEKDFYDFVKVDILRNMVMKILNISLPMPVWLMDEVYNVRYQSRIADIVTVFFPDQRSVVQPTDLELQNLYEKNGDKFFTPEYREADYISLCLSDVGNKVNVSKHEVDSALSTDEYKDLLDRRDVVNLVISDRMRAMSAKAEIEGGASLEHVVSSYGNSDLESVILRDVSKYDLQIELRKVFDMHLGEIAVLKSSLGWHLVKVEKIYGASVKEMDNIKEGVREQLLLEKRVKYLREIVQNIEDDISSSSINIRDISRKYGVSYTALSPIDSKGYDQDERLISIPLDIRYELLSSVFDRQVGEQREFLSNSTGTCYLNVYVNDVISPKKMDFERARKSLYESFVVSKRKNDAIEYANSIMNKMKGGEVSIDEIASMTNVIVEKNKSIYHYDAAVEINPLQKLPVNFVKSIFKEENGAVTNVVGGEDKFFIAKVNGYKDAPDVLENKELYRRMKGKIQDLHSTIIHEEVFDNLKNQYNIYIKPEFMSVVE